MQTTDLHDIAAALRTARADGKPIPAPTTTWPALDADAAFEVQRITVDQAVAGGDRMVGYKLGNIAKVM
jgi:2-keto-4-pentenoate hydratase